MTDHPLTPERIDAFRDRHIDTYSYAQEIFDAGREHERTATKENLARLRDTPVGRALMAEAWESGWDAGVKDAESSVGLGTANPYLGGNE